jgi:hypothetical protein
MSTDLDHAFRVLFDDDGFVNASVGIVSRVREDLAAGDAPQSRVDAQFDAIARSIERLSPRAEEALFVNLNKVCGDAEEGRATYYNFLSALYQDNCNLQTRARPCLVDAAFRVFRQHSLPIDSSTEGLLANYYRRIVEATGAPWSVGQLTRETVDRHKVGWYPDPVLPVRSTVR